MKMKKKNNNMYAFKFTSALCKVKISILHVQYYQKKDTYRICLFNKKIFCFEKK